MAKYFSNLISKRQNTNMHNPDESAVLDVDAFYKKYQRISASESAAIHSVKSNVCRYCGRDYKTVTFNQATHLLPELLGANDLLTFDECDPCNALFSKYESHLSNFIRPFITLTGIKSKHKIPAFHSRTENADESTRTILTHETPRHKKLIISNREDCELDKANNKVKFTFRLPPITLLNVYKSLVKIGLTLLPKELEESNKLAFQWITGQIEDIHFYDILFSTTLTKAIFKRPFAELYKTKSLRIDQTEYPEYTLILGFANQVFQLYLPFSKAQSDSHIKGSTLDLEVFPAFMLDSLNESSTRSIHYCRLGSEIPVKGNRTIWMAYQEIQHTES